MITDDDAEAALDFMRDNADKAAHARADRLYMEDYTRVLKSEIMKEHLDKAVNAQEREAYADARYKDHLEALRTAIFEDEKLGFLMKAAETKVSAWQTFSANMRPKI